jgi:hypothetical protein
MAMMAGVQKSIISAPRRACPLAADSVNRFIQESVNLFIRTSAFSAKRFCSDDLLYKK